MSFFSELKRRNVVRMGLAYALIAWVLLQAADFSLDLIDAPNWVIQALVMLALLGLPVALVFSWIYEMTPEGIRRESDIDRSRSIAAGTGHKLDRIIIVFLVVAVGVLLAERFIGQESSSTVPAEQGVATTAETPEQRSTANTTDNPSVAVLPFANMSPDPDNEYFADGISEELLNLLVRVENLRVPSRTSSFAFKGQNMDIREIARQLEVGHILEGSVRKSGNQVRITAQLIDVSTDTHLWSETFDRELEDIFTIQDEIAGQIVTALQGVLGGAITHETPTENLEAYNLFLQGRYQFQQRGQNLIEAEKLLQQSVDLDPVFAEAWAYLGLTRIMLPNYLNAPLDESIAAALQAADQAALIDPNLAEPYMVRANAALKSRDPVKALEIYEQHIGQNTSHTLARAWYAISLFATGYIAEAHGHLEIALNQDPASGLILDWISRAEYALGHLDLAEKHAIKAIQFRRDQSWQTLVSLYRAAGEPEKLDEIPPITDEQNAKMFDITRRVLKGELSDEQAVQEAGEVLGPSGLPFILVYLSEINGDVDRMATAMAEVLERDTSSLEYFWSRESHALRNHPAGKDLLRSYRVPEVWKTRGWPDLCQPVGDDDWECD